MSGMRSGSAGSCIDPSNLHLKKELTQIQKAARVLRDPGTTSSWRSPLSSSRSTVAVTGAVQEAAASSTTTLNAVVNSHYYHHYRIDTSYSVEEPNDDNVNATSIDNSNNNGNGVGSGSGNRRREKEKVVFLYNWRTQKSESERSASVTGQTDDYRRQSTQGNADRDGHGEESVDDSLSDGQNPVDSRSDDFRYGLSTSSKLYKNVRKPPIRRSSLIRKKKPKKNTHLNHHLHQLSLVDHSDDTEEYANVNSEDAIVKGISVISPFVSRSKSSKLLSGNGRKADSCHSTPRLSISSFNKYWPRNPSTVGSWDATTVSFNDGDGLDDDDDDDDQLDLPGRHGCGIPCCWSSSKRSTPKHGGVCGSCYSPSFSDSLRRKGSSILRGSQTMYRRQCRGSSIGASNKKRLIARTAQGLVPLLTSSADGRGGSSGGTDDELATNYGELDLEALSRLDGRRWSTSCRSQEGLELVAVNGEREDTPLSPENVNCLSHKYRPMFFEDLVGQNIVVQSLMSAIMRGRIVPVYLFQGARGTGKTSTARIFAAALNCLASGKTKPCGICKECAEFISGKSRGVTEVDVSNKEGIERVKYILKKLKVGPTPSTFIKHEVYIIDECHLFPSKLWLEFVKFLEEPPSDVVFIFVTTDLDNVPCTLSSRCQKYLFNKIKDGDIVSRLRKISLEENLDVEVDALDLIAQNVEGSLRDAETMLDQLSLLGKRITTSLVNELVGVVSDEKLLELLELAMSSSTAETVKRARELMDSGVDPMVLMSQMATLIMDIIAGTYQDVETRYSDSFFDGRSLTEAELERLKHALKLLSESEKQLRVSSERSTWFTATLLQLGSVPLPDPTHSGSRRQSSRTNEGDPSTTLRDSCFQKQRLASQFAPCKSTSPMYPPKTDQNSTHPEDSHPPRSRLMNGDEAFVSQDEFMVGNTIRGSSNSDILDDIWVHCIEKCHSKTLRQLLRTYGKLVSISEAEGVFVAYIVFGNRDIKSRAERFISSITNSFEIVLRRNIEVRIILLSDERTTPNCEKGAVLPQALIHKQIETTGTTMDNKVATYAVMDDFSDRDSLQEPLKLSRGSFNDSEGKLAGTIRSSTRTPLILAEGSAKMNASEGRKTGNPVQRIESIIHEQRLETAWLQTAEKGTPGSLNRLKPERNQVLPQDDIYPQSQMESINSMKVASQQQWEDELTCEIDRLKINEGKALSKESTSQHYPMSPSLLHESGLGGKFNNESFGYESGSGCGSCFCWNNRNRRGKIKLGTSVCSRKGGRFVLFGECAKSRLTEHRSRR